MFTGQYELEVEHDGTVRLPPEVADLLGEHIVLVGVADHVELWRAEDWYTYVRDWQPELPEGPWR